MTALHRNEFVQAVSDERRRQITAAGARGQDFSKKQTVYVYALNIQCLFLFVKGEFPVGEMIF